MRRPVYHIFEFSSAEPKGFESDHPDNHSSEQPKPIFLHLKVLSHRRSQVHNRAVDSSDHQRTVPQAQGNEDKTAPGENILLILQPEFDFSAQIMGGFRIAAQEDNHFRIIMDVGFQPCCGRLQIPGGHKIIGARHDFIVHPEHTFGPILNNRMAPGRHPG